MLLEVTSKHMKGEKVTRGNKPGFTKGRWCLPNFIAFYDEVTDIVDKGRERDVECLDFHKAFVTVSCSLLVIIIGEKSRWPGSLG